MIWNYRGAGLLFAKRDKHNKFVICLGKRNWKPLKGYYSMLGGQSNGNPKTILGMFRVKDYIENFRATALREAREECKLIGNEFPGMNQLIPLSEITLGIYNWTTFGYFIENPETKIVSTSGEFDELNWYETDQLPSPMFLDLRSSILKFEALIKKGNKID